MLGVYYDFDGLLFGGVCFVMLVVVMCISLIFGVCVYLVSGVCYVYLGVDFVVLVGCVVYVLECGVVMFIGIELCGYGKYVVICYDGGYVLYYVYLLVFELML